MGTFAGAQFLEPDDYRGILAVLDVVEHARTPTDFQRLALEAVDEHLGYRRSTFVVGEPPAPGFRRFAGSPHGLKQVDLEEYFERWTAYDPFVSLAATGRMRRGALVELTELANEVLPDQRRYVEQFLLRQATSQLTLWLDTGLPTHGYLSVFGIRPTEFSPRDRAILLTLRPHLAFLLRAILLDGRPHADAGRLSRREAEVGTLVTLGCSNREIARHLGIEEDTVKKHLLHAMDKLGVRNRTQLALLLRRGSRE